MSIKLNRISVGSMTTDVLDIIKLLRKLYKPIQNLTANNMVIITRALDSYLYS